MTGPGPWPDDLRRFIAGVERAVPRAMPGAAGQAKLDQSAAWLRDQMDHYGIDPYNPEALRVGLGMMAIYVKALRSTGIPNKRLDAVAAGVIANLLDHLPLEARP